MNKDLNNRNFNFLIYADCIFLWIKGRERNKLRERIFLRKISERDCERNKIIVLKLNTDDDIKYTLNTDTDIKEKNYVLNLFVWITNIQIDATKKMKTIQVVERIFRKHFF